MKLIIVCIYAGFLALASTQVLAASAFVDDVVVVYCERESAASGTVLATHAASSSGAPAVSVGPNSNCAEELAKLTNGKFRIHSVVAADSSYVVYTLVRK